MPETNCKFCKQLKNLKEDFEYYASKRPSIKSSCSTKCTVALVDNHFYEGQYSGRASFGFDELKFCPLCGRTIANDELEW